MTLTKKTFELIMVKEEYTGNQHFFPLLFQMLTHYFSKNVCKSSKYEWVQNCVIHQYVKYFNILIKI